MKWMKLNLAEASFLQSYATDCLKLGLFVSILKMLNIEQVDWGLAFCCFLMAAISALISMQARGRDEP